MGHTNQDELISLEAKMGMVEESYRDLHSKLHTIVQETVDRVLRRPIAYGRLLIYGPTVEQVLRNPEDYMPWFCDFVRQSPRGSRISDLAYRFLFGQVPEE